ncbi:hypothetical protein AKJ61_02995 [candidate division MSBL1 archaeon SCGC-AAA259B11]|uniref:Uncharacterized protein n=1 Tax=candidate division MSBL1 archaeon SCGC-AAA259B11 TaxID=1698260 RepID=A0A133U5D0_9EURY|nr:hypothetical protein AKJ61_02995 [candidate division MSBL1 archaeon SCGC-AAA259B11]
MGREKPIDAVERTRFTAFRHKPGGKRDEIGGYRDHGEKSENGGWDFNLRFLNLIRYSWYGVSFSRERNECFYTKD